MNKFYCIKEVLLNDHDNTTVINYNNYFKVGDIYDFLFENTEYSSYNYVHKNSTVFYRFKSSEIEEFFISIDEMRNQIINNILENDK